MSYIADNERNPPGTPNTVIIPATPPNTGPPQISAGPSPEEVYAAILAASQYSGPSAHDMAANQFAPQFAALQNAINQSNQRGEVAKKDVGAMFESLAQSTAARMPEIQQQYANTTGGIKNAYNEATQGVQNASNASINNIASILQRLGIQQAAPDLMQQQQGELNRNLADLARRSTTNTTFNDQLGQNEQSYLGRTVDTNRLAGKNAVTDIIRKLQDIMAGYENKRMDLTAGQTGAENQYGMSISQMNSAAGAAAAKAAQDARDFNYKVQSGNRDYALRADQYSNSNDMAQARLMLDTQRYGSDLSNQDVQNNLRIAQNADPVTALQMAAGQSFNDAGDASSAVNDVLSVYSKNRPTDLGTFLSLIDEQYGTDALQRQRYEQLASSFFNRIQNRGY